MTTKTNRRAEVAAWRDLSQAIALSAIYSTAAEKGARDGMSEWSAEELRNAARCLGGAAEKATQLANILTGKRGRK